MIKKKKKNIRCFTCKGTDHMAVNCPLTHYMKNKDFIKKVRNDRHDN